MIRAFLRLIGFTLLSIAFIALVLDGVAFLVNEEGFKPAVAGKTWQDLSPTTLNQTQFAIQEHLGLVWFWDNVVQWLLLQPTAAVLAGFGLFFCLIGRKKKKKEGFAT